MSDFFVFETYKSVLTASLVTILRTALISTSAQMQLYVIITRQSVKTIRVVISALATTDFMILQIQLNTGRQTVRI